jgi:hypothetical protein
VEAIHPSPSRDGDRGRRKALAVCATVSFLHLFRTLHKRARSLSV